MSNILYSIGPMDDEDKVPIISLNSLCRLLNSMYIYIYIKKAKLVHGTIKYPHA